MTFYFDHSIQPAVPEALSKVRDDVRWAGQPGMPKHNWRDEEWLAFVAERGWTALMRDKRVRYRPAEKRALQAPGIRGAFILTTAGNYNRWQVLELLVSRWSSMEETIANSEPPFICAVTKAGIRPFE